MFSYEVTGGLVDFGLERGVEVAFVLGGERRGVLGEGVGRV